MERASIHRFLALAATHHVFDVRSPGEFARGHLPGAHSLPLFEDQERAEVGACYVQQGQRPALLVGLERVGPKLRGLIEQVMAWADPQDPATRHVLVHCWRGGMRSQSVAWLLELAGFEVTTLEGGYKAFRRWALETLTQPRPLMILGGLTGSSKTERLQALRQAGQQVIDLEALAHHRGSTFGALLMPAQPTTEHFENRLAWAWAQADPARLLWLEDESRNVGRCFLPEGVWDMMRQAPVIFLEVPIQARQDHLVSLYGEASAQQLIDCFEHMRKRLGGQRATLAVEHVRRGQLRQAAALALDYYDKTYLHGLSQRDPTRVLRLSAPPEVVDVGPLIQAADALVAQLASGQKSSDRLADPLGDPIVDPLD